MIHLLFQLTTSALVVTATPLNRTILVINENRITKIPFENRITMVINEDRITKIPFENRTLLVKFESRSKIITGDE